MYTLICGSPKSKDSNSMYFLKQISKFLSNYQIKDLKKDEYNDIITNMNGSDTVVLAFPLYVDSPPSITLKFLDYIIDNNIDIKNKLFYVVINCGFREGEQNITGLNIIKCWCKKNKIKYGCAILIGAGEIVGKPHYKLICRKALKNLKKFSIFIKNKTVCNEIITTMDFLDNKIYCYLANCHWDKKGKNNNLKKEDIRTL